MTVLIMKDTFYVKIYCFGIIKSTRKFKSLILIRILILVFIIALKNKKYPKYNWIEIKNKNRNSKKEIYPIIQNEYFV